MNLKTILASTALAVVGLTATQAGWAQSYTDLSPQVREAAAHSTCVDRSVNQWQYDQCMASHARGDAALHNLSNGGQMTLQDIMDIDRMFN